MPSGIPLNPTGLNINYVIDRDIGFEWVNNDDSTEKFTYENIFMQPVPDEVKNFIDQR